MFELQARNKGISFAYEATGDLPKVVRADQKRLSQILINILGNAVKFTQYGGVTFRLQYARELAIIEIEDTGPGIEQEEIDAIFEPFTRGSAANNGSIGGTGLGLTISKMLTQLMGGQLTVKSAVGEGSVFQIRLFLSQVRIENEDEAVSTATRIGYTGHRRKVLVVDNEAVDRGLLVHILEPLGFEMAEAANGKECLALYTEFKPDVILMDLAMPVMDGWEASYVIRRVHESTVPIGIVSANAFDKGLENTAGIGAEDFILKPVNLEELLDWLETTLGLEWITAPEPLLLQESPLQANDLVLPPEKYIQELLALIKVGYVRGISKKLDEIAALDEGYPIFVDVMRKLAKQFQLEAMKKFVEELGSSSYV